MHISAAKLLKESKMCNQIKNFEKKYMSKIWAIINSELFISDLRKIESYIQSNYNFLNDNWDEKNKLKVGVERLIRYYFYSNLGVVGVYPSPLSSDMAVELKDVILNIDAKTIDMVGNPGDDNAIHFGKNQITFDNVPFFSQVIQGISFPGVTFPPRLASFHNEKPCLTFFITINYFDDSTSFRLSHLSLCCVPHALIVKHEFENKIISNFKTYEYLGKVKAESLGTQFLPKPRIDASWIPFSLKQTGVNDSFLDRNLNHPILGNSKCVWKIIASKYAVLIYGGSARIDKGSIRERKDSEGNTWIGVQKKEGLG